MCCSVPPYPYPLPGSFKTLCPSCQVSRCRPAAEALFCSYLSTHSDRLLEINQGNSLWRWPGVRDKWLSLLQSSWSLVPTLLWCPCHNTASGEDEKGLRSVCPLISKYLPLHKHLQLFIEQQSPQHVSATSLCISETSIRISRLLRSPRLTALEKEVLCFSTVLRKGTQAQSCLEGVTLRRQKTIQSGFISPFCNKGV